MEALLDGRKIDFLFIDGDHSDAGVRRDFELFHDLVGSDGLIGFHNILDDSASCQVHRFWNEVKARYRHEELVADPHRPWRGIGLLHVE